jgi:hypothetical protein
MGRHPSDEVGPEATELIELGSELSGIAAATAVGGLVGGPIGAAAGALGAPVLKQALRSTLTELASRHLGNREKSRVGAVVGVAVETVDRNLRDGKSPRSDWWGAAANSQGARELIEGVLVAAQREHEESEIRLMGKLLGNLLFETRIDRDYANQLIRMAERLSYRQIVLLALFDIRVRDAKGLHVGPIDLQGGKTPTMSVLHDILELYRSTMLQQVSEDHPGTTILLDLTAIDPSKVQVVLGPGGWLHDLMEMPGSVFSLDVERVASLLR